MKKVLFYFAHIHFFLFNLRHIITILLYSTSCESPIYMCVCIYLRQVQGMALLSLLLLVPRFWFRQTKRAPSDQVSPVELQEAQTSIAK